MCSTRRKGGQHNKVGDGGGIESANIEAGTSSDEPLDVGGARGD